MYGNFLSCIFAKNFVKVTDLLNKLLKSLLDEKKKKEFGEREFLVFPQCVYSVEITRILSHAFLAKISRK